MKIVGTAKEKKRIISTSTWEEKGRAFRRKRKKEDGVSVRGGLFLAAVRKRNSFFLGKERKKSEVSRKEEERKKRSSPDPERASAALRKRKGLFSSQGGRRCGSWKELKRGKGNQRAVEKGVPVHCDERGFAQLFS